MLYISELASCLTGENENVITSRQWTSRADRCAVERSLHKQTYQITNFAFYCILSSWWRCCLGHSKNFSDDDDDDDVRLTITLSFRQFYLRCFSKRELTLICYRPSACLSSVCLSACLSSVTFVRLTKAIEIFGNVSTPFCTLATSDLSIKILRRSSQGNPSVLRKG